MCGKHVKLLPILLETENDLIGHGDELSYIFEAKNLDGSEIKEKEELTEDDRKVRDTFTQMISEFARNGRISINNQNVPSFSSKENNFVQISSKPKLSNNFRYCEMALWAGLPQRLQSSSCQFINVFDNQLKNVGNVFFDTIKTPTRNEGIVKAESKVTDVLNNPFGMLQKKQQPTLGFGIF